MADIISFPSRKQTPLETQVSNLLEKHLANYQWNHGRDAYWHYVKKHGKLPEPKTAVGLSRLLGHKVKGGNFKYFHPPGNKAEPKTHQKMSAHGERLIMLVEKLANTIAERGTSGTTVALELKKNKSEHIANHSEVALRWLADFHKEWISEDERQVDIAPKNPGICIAK